jgi:hypothetical protein
MSSLFMAAIIALASAYFLRNVSADGPVPWWPYFAFAWAFVSVAVPWGIGVDAGFLPEEFHPGMSLMFGVIFALPFWQASRWLAHTPYHLFVFECRFMIGLWGIHVLASLGLWIHARLTGRHLLEE